MLIYDGECETQEAFRASVLEHPSSRSRRGESLGRSSISEVDKSSLRRSHSEDLLSGPVAKRSNARRKRGEVNVRIVDFARTTTGQDWVPHPDPNYRNLNEGSLTGYGEDIDPETGLIFARFPPHYPEQPDRGFITGLRSLARTLERIWNKERLRRIKASRDNPSATHCSPLPPISTDGKEIFDEIFGVEEDQGMISS